MMELLAILGLAGLLGILALVTMGGFRVVDLLPLAVISSVVLFIGRFDAMLAVTVGGRPFMGVILLFLVWLFVLAVLNAAQRGQPSLGLSRILHWTLAFAVAGLVSAMVNGGSKEALAAVIQVLCLSLLPLGVAMLLVNLLPRDRRALEHLITTFVLVNGVVVPVVMILNAVSRGYFQDIMGWKTQWAHAETRLTEASTFLGGRITSGNIAFLAYGLAMTHFVAKRRWTALVPMGLCAFSTFFSLSRTNLLLMVVFHVVFFWQSVSRHLARVLLLVTLAVGGFFYAAPKLTERYSFERLTTFKGPTVNVRTVSIKAAFLASLRAPVLGQGPGLLYKTFRVEWLYRAEKTRPEMIVEGYRVPLEPHNIYAFLAAEHGVVGLVTFTAIFLILWRRTQFRGWRALSKEDQTYRAGYNAVWIAWLLGMWVHSMQLFEIKPSLMFWVFAFSGLLWRHCALQGVRRAPAPARAPVRTRAWAGPAPLTGRRGAGAL